MNDSTVSVLDPRVISCLPAAEDLDRAEEKMLQGVQPVTFLKHHFSPGIYVREIWMPEGSIVLGHRHRTRHLNVVAHGEALVRINGQIFRAMAPWTFESDPGVRKALAIVRDMTWLTIHANPDDCQDVEVLELRLMIPTPAWEAAREKQEAHAAFCRLKGGL